MIGTGELKVDPIYKDITVPDTVFHQSVKQKQAVLKKFNNHEMKSNENVLPVNGRMRALVTTRYLFPRNNLGLFVSPSKS